MYDIMTTTKYYNDLTQSCYSFRDIQIEKLTIVSLLLHILTRLLTKHHNVTLHPDLSFFFCYVGLCQTVSALSWFGFLFFFKIYVDQICWEEIYRSNVTLISWGVVRGRLCGAMSRRIWKDWAWLETGAVPKRTGKPPPVKFLAPCAPPPKKKPR